jgi:transcriptional regulator with XRE-family HTH domain
MAVRQTSMTASRRIKCGIYVNGGRENATPVAETRTRTLHSPAVRPDRCFLLADSYNASEPLVVRYQQYKPCMVHLRSRLAAFIRQRRGSMPQRMFARKTGLAQSSIMRIENEDQNVTLETLEILCKTFHVDVAELFPPVNTIRVYQPPVRISADLPMIHETQVPELAPAQAKEVNK